MSKKGEPAFPPKMKAAVYREFGDPDKVLKIEDDYPTPKPSKDQIRVRVDATSINPIDWKIMKGKTSIKKLPMIPCMDVAGTVVQLGHPNTGKFRKGEKVVSKLPPSEGGAMAEYCVVEELLTVPKPAEMSAEEAAGLPLAGMTALQGLKTGDIAAGKKVLILGASGGVGTFAVQIAKAFGCQVAATCGTSAIDLVKSLGADDVIDYHTADWRDVLKGKDFDIIFDTVGGNWEGAEKVAKISGAFVTIVGDEPHQENWDAPQLEKIKAAVEERQRLHAEGKTPQYYFILTQDKLEDLAELITLVHKGKLKTVIDKVFPMERAQEAFKYNAGGHTKGKVVVTITPPPEAL